MKSIILTKDLKINKKTYLAGMSYLPQNKEEKEKLLKEKKQ